MPAKKKTAPASTPPSPRSDTILIQDWRRGQVAGASFIWPLDEVSNRRGGLELYRRLFESVDVIRSCVLMKTAAIVSGFSVEATDPNSGLSVEAAAALQEDLEALSFERALSELVTSSVVFGMGVASPRWDLGSPRIKVVGCRVINPTALTFKVDEYGQVIGISQRNATGGGESEIDPARVVHLTAGELSHGDPYGVSELKGCVRLAWMRDNIMQWMAVFMERYSEPPTIAKVPHAMSEEKQHLVLQALSRLSPRSALVVPPDMDVTLLESQRDPRSVFISVLDALDVRLARALLMPDKLGFSTRADDRGSWALADVQSRLWMLHVENQRKHVEAVINRQLIHPMLIWGGFQDAKVKFKLSPLTPEDKAATVAQWTQLVGAGVVTSGDEDEKRLRKLLQMPEEAEDGSTREEHERGVVALSEKSGCGVRFGGGRHTRSPARKGGGGTRSSAASSSSLTFNDPGDEKLWRELNQAERRADVVRMSREEREEAKVFAAVVGESAAELVADDAGRWNG